MRRRLLAVLLGLALAAVAAEGIARVVESRGSATPPLSAPMAFRPHALLAFELTPGAVRRGRETIGPHGFRGAPPLVPKPDGVRRVVCIGGSTTYGDGLEDGATYPERLEALLEGRAEVVNLGVPGYTTAESLLNLCLKGLDLEPDAIVVYHAVNDYRPRTVPELDAGYRVFRRVWVEEELERTPLAQALESSALARVLRGREVARHGLFAMIEQDVPRRLDRAEIVAADRLWIFERNLRALVAVAHGRGIGVVLATQAQDPTALSAPEDSEPIEEHNAVTRRVAEETGASLCEVARAFPLEGSFQPGDPVHLTAAGSLEQARRVRDALLASGRLERAATEEVREVSSAWPEPASERGPTALVREEVEALADARVLRPVAYQGWDLAPRSEGPGRLGPHDARGFRGAARDAARSVVLLGGASAYGLGVGDAQTTARRLEALLDDVGVVNAGVPGHTSAQTVARLHFQVLAELRPDVVVLALDVEDALAVAAPGYRNDYGHLLKGFRDEEPAGTRAWLVPGGREGRDPLGVGAPLRALRPARPPYDPGGLGRAPGDGALARNLRTAVDLARGAGARVVLLRGACGDAQPIVRRAFEVWNAALDEVARATGAEVADAAAGFDPALHVLPGGWLPSPAGHAHRAEALARVLR